MIRAKHHLRGYHMVCSAGALAIAAILPLPLKSWAEIDSKQQTQAPTPAPTPEQAIAVERVDATLHAQAQAQAQVQVQAQIRVEDIFSESAKPDVAGQRCLPARRIRSVDVLDNKTLVFDMGRDKNYLVRLKRECFGLRRHTPISYELHGLQFCKHDGFRALETWGFNRLVSLPRCFIPAFIPVNDMERDLVKARVKTNRDAKVAARKAERAARRVAKAAAKATSGSDQQQRLGQGGKSA